MKKSAYLILKYWHKHKKNAAALLFSGMLLTTVVFVTLMLKREEYARFFHEVYDAHGHYDVLIANSDDEILAKAAEGYSGYNYGVMYVYGEMGYGGNYFEYGTLDDEHNIWHVPLDEGRMPETEDEIAAVSTVLDACFWVGKCGDTITLNGETYTVTGIINENYGINRQGSRLSKYLMFEESPYKIPLIFVGKCDKAPLFRFDMLGNLFDLKKSPEAHELEFDEYQERLREVVGYEMRWFDCASERQSFYYDIYNYNSPQLKLFKIISWIGAGISVLSVFSVLRTVFTERRGRIETLRRIGMKKSAVGVMYAVEGTVFTAAQIIFGIVFGLAAYGGILLFKVAVLGEAPYNGLTPPYLVYEKTENPFLWAAVISSIISVISYILNALTVNFKLKSPDKNRRPASLSRCFGRVFRQRGVTVIQTAALMLICFSVLFGYVFLTDNGKEWTDGLTYLPPSSNYSVEGFNMEDEGIAEYYSAALPQNGGIGHMDRDYYERLFTVCADYTAGIDDEIAGKLPEYALAAGYIRQSFLALDEPNAAYINEIDLSNEHIRQTLLGMSSEEHQNFFDEGQLGSKHLYNVGTKITPPRNIETLSKMAENVRDGEIDIDALNSGDEILVAYQGKMPPFKAGETVTVCSIGSADKYGFGVGSINTAEVRIGAILQITPSIGAVRNYTLRNDQDYNFLTTATGANAMGLHCARYNEIYSAEPMDGGIIPSSAEMRVISLEAMKREENIKKMQQYGASILILLVMSLLGFAAYFNGIGMKIRLKAYNISVMRAVGTRVSEIRRRLLLSSIKIPLAASAAAYGIVKAMQFAMKRAYQYYLDEYTEALKVGFSYDSPLGQKLSTVRNRFYLDGVLWQVNAEIPTLILFAVICAVTVILTTIALKKFKRDIAGDLSEGRTRE